MEQSASPFLILYFDLLPASAFAKPRIATDDAAVAVQIFDFDFFISFYVNDYLSLIHK